MKLKISLFDKSIIKSDVKRFWWVSALYAVILLFSLPLQHMLQDLPIKDNWQKEALLNSLRLSDPISIQQLLICTLPVFLAVMLFGYLHSTRAAAMIHSLPLNRNKLFGSHAASGILLISAPVLTTAVVLGMLASFSGLGEYYTVVNVIEWTGLTLLFNFLLFSIAVFVGMFTGNAIAHIVFTYIINVLPFGLYMLVAYNLEEMLYGFSADRLSSDWAQTLPLIKIFIFNFNDFTFIQGLLYLLTAFVFLVAAGVSYNRRKLEAAGNIVAFRTAQPVFKYGVAASLMLTGGFITGYINNARKPAIIAAYFIFAFLGYWISQMLLEKTVRVWHAYKGFLVFNAVVILLLAGISADVTGYVRRIPMLGEVESAYFGNSYHSWLRVKNKLPEAELFSTKGLFTEGKNIKAVMNLHKVLINSRNEDYGREQYIAYILKSGRSVVRKYTVDEHAVRMLLKPLYESLEYKKGIYPVLEQKVQDIKLIEIGDRRTSKKPLILSDEKQIQSFTDVMKKELTDANYEEITEPEYKYAYIEITDRNDRTAYYDLKRSFKAMHAWLEDNGYYESAMLVPEDIDHVSVKVLKVTGYKSGYGYTESGISMDLNDKPLIRELIDICHSNLNMANSGTCLKVDFYSQAKAANPDFDGFVYPDTPMSEELLQKLSELGKGSGTAGQ